VSPYWWLTQNTAADTTRIMRNRIAQASTLLSGLRLFTGLLMVRSPLYDFYQDAFAVKFSLAPTASKDLRLKY